MLRTFLASLIRAALAHLVEEGRLPSEVLTQRIEIADPKKPEHGDFACNIAMTASKVAEKNPREFAEMLVGALGSQPVFDKIEIAGPGFINLTLNSEFVASQVRTINALGQNELAKQNPVENPLKINVEFVSVNPNGPITIGSGRGAAYGSTLCNIFEAAGHTVHREYYINDGVNSEQMRQFATSLRSYIFLRIFGEYASSQGTDFTRPDCLEPVEAFIQSLNPNRLPQSTEILDCYQEFVRLHRHEFSELVQKNSTYDYYAQQRPAQLLKFARECWSSGTYVSPLEELYKFSYKGDYVFSVVQTILDEELEPAYGEDKFAMWLPVIFTEESVVQLQQIAQDRMISFQKEALESFGVNYDTWFSEQSLHDSGTVASEIESLAAKGIANTDPTRTKLKLAKGGKIEDVIIESQTADVDDEGEVQQAEATAEGETLWLRSTKLGDDMDRVLLRKDGRLTYIASDVAYHKDKFNRPADADKLITILGPDHHGYIGRLTAVVAAMLLQPSEPGEPCQDEFDAKLYRDENEKAACQKALKEAREKLEVQIYQLVRFVKDGKPAPMRKRDGNIYALIDLMREIGTKLKPEGTEAEQLESGKDVARFFYLMRSHDTTFDFDLDLAEKQSDENPVFYVQYAHARICSILEKAGEQGEANLSLLTHPKEKTLIKRIADLPNEVSRSAEDYGVHRLTTYAIELARAFHGFYGDCKVNDPQQPGLSAARIQLCEATQKALKETLDLLGVSAPERM